MKELFFVLVMVTVLSTSYAQEKSVLTIIKETCAKASKENKKAFIIFHASWCVWCVKLDSSLNDASCKKFFDDNYIIGHVTVFEVNDKTGLNNPGAEKFLAAHHAKDQGIPAWFIFDKNENLLADSQLRPKGAGFKTEGTNIGCPSNETEINYFINVLRKTSSINEQQVQTVRQRFILNKDALTH